MKDDLSISLPAKHRLLGVIANPIPVARQELRLADRLGLDVSLAFAASHLFVRWRNDDGEIVTLETTSGANPARDVWFVQNGLLNEQAIATGFYRRSLPRREAIAAMVTAGGPGVGIPSLTLVFDPALARTSETDIAHEIGLHGHRKKQQANYRDQAARSEANWKGLTRIRISMPPAYP